MESAEGSVQLLRDAGEIALLSADSNAVVCIDGGDGDVLIPLRVLLLLQRLPLLLLPLLVPWQPCLLLLPCVRQ